MSNQRVPPLTDLVLAWFAETLDGDVEDVEDAAGREILFEHLASTGDTRLPVHLSFYYC